MALLQPLTLLDLVAYHKENSDLQRLSEMRCLHPYESIPFEIRKSTIAIFLSEILYKCIREEGPSEELFTFLEQSMLFFDQLEDGYQNFHLQFLMKLSRFLGFGLDTAPSFMMGLNEEEGMLARRLLDEGYGAKIVLGRNLRRMVLDHIIDFYRQHVEGFGEVRSLSVLQEVF